MYLRILSNLTGLESTADDPNAGGIRRLRLIPCDHISGIFLPDWYPRSDQIGFQPLQINGDSILIHENTAFVDLPVLPEYASYSEDMQPNENGPYYRPTIQIVLPKDQPTVTAWCHRWRNVRWIALIQDRNGWNRLVGTPDQPLEMALTNTLGAAKGKNARSLTFSASCEIPAPYVDAIENADLFPEGAFDDAFGFAFAT